LSSLRSEPIVESVCDRSGMRVSVGEICPRGTSP